jgi:hypothetical protein
MFISVTFIYPTGIDLKIYLQASINEPTQNEETILTSKLRRPPCIPSSPGCET